MSNYHLHNHNDTHSHDDDHSSNHDNHNHALDFNDIRQQRTTSFKIIMALTAIFSIVEFIGGYFTHSLALVSDAFHMVTDSSAIFLALIMSSISTRPADDNHSYGHGRADILGALINSIFMIGIIGFLLYESFEKFLHPSSINAVPMIFIASVGLCINIISAKILHSSHQTNLNSRAAFIHIMGDLLSSLATIVAGGIIYYTQWNFLDPLLSSIIGIIIIPSTYKVIKQSIHILMEGVPESINFNEVGNTMSALPGIVSVHDLHIWVMSSETVSLSAHVIIRNTLEWETVLHSIQKLLSEKYNIYHVTLQPELLKQEHLAFKPHIK